ncbi:MAG: AI-2E family transporter [Erysipelotrichaceae bacterium]|nr:AI-2E family transporter [Erysipelotrichaceae bacterium]
MHKFFKDADIRKSIAIITVSGILISLFVILLTHFTDFKEILRNLFTALSPFIWGILFAAILGKLAIRIETSLPAKLSYKTRRFIGAIISVLLLIIVITVFVIVITPTLVESIGSISTVLKNFANDPSAWISNIENSLHLPDDIVKSIYTYSNNIAQSIWKVAQDFIPTILSATVATVSGIVNFIIGLIICLYILMDRQKLAVSLKRLATVMLDQRQYVKGRKIMYLSIEKFANFFSGKILDSIIIGIICFICMMFINQQYAALISMVIGVTNIIPFFGPFIGAVPCALILLIVEPFDCLIFVIMVIILQQVDGNIIGPRILGNSVGLSSLWIMFAIIVGGYYFGFYGMLLGVPVFSVFYYMIKESVDDRLEEKNKEAD